MRTPIALFPLMALVAFTVASPRVVAQSAAPDVSPAAIAITPGRYEGSLDTGNGAVTPIVLRLLPGGGGLVDLPGESLFGYPLSGLAISGDRLAFTLGASSPEPGDGAGAALRFDAAVVSTQPALRLEGSCGNAQGKAPFFLVATQAAPSPEEEIAVRVKGGALHGGLLLPEGAGPFPLVVIVPGAGTTDRDGNNYAVPGKCDSLKGLAYALRADGVASFRYDKRGAGESYPLAGREEDSRFDDYIDDAVAVLSSFAGDARFSRVIVAGHTEGALVAAAAANRLASGAAAPAGLVLLCATGKTAVQTVEEALSGAPDGLKPEAAAIMAALEDGKSYANPSAYFADFFRPSFQGYLSSWFRYDLSRELASWKGPVALVQGDKDFQVSLEDFGILAAARPDAPAFVIPDMNHALKLVSSDLDENYKSFSDPSFPIAKAMCDLVASLALGKELPSGLPRYDGGSLRQDAPAAP